MNGILVTLACGAMLRQYVVHKGQYFNGNPALIVQDVDNTEHKALVTCKDSPYGQVKVTNHPVVKELIRTKLLEPQGIATDGKYICKMYF